MGILGGILNYFKKEFQESKDYYKNQKQTEQTDYCIVYYAHGHLVQIYPFVPRPYSDYIDRICSADIVISDMVEYDLSNEDSISSIVIPNYSIHAKSATDKDLGLAGTLEFVLSAKGDEYWKCKKYDLAISCYAKSTELMLYSDEVWSKSDFYYIVGKLKSIGMNKEAAEWRTWIDNLFNEQCYDGDLYSANRDYEEYLQEQREKIENENEFLGITNKRYKSFKNAPFDPINGYQSWSDVPIIPMKELDKLFRKEMDQYNIVEARLQMQYSVVWHSKDFWSIEAEQLIKDCIKATKYVIPFKTYYQVVAISHRNDPLTPYAVPLEIPKFFPYIKLAIIYEKRKEYDKAIDICDEAIRLGLIEDGTKGKFPGRRARLIAKSEK